MKIAFIYAKGRLSRINRVTAVHAASEFFYGSLQLMKKGHEVRMFEVDEQAPPSWLQRLGDFFARREWLPSRTHGGLLYHLNTLRPKLQGVDVVVATTTGIAFSIGLLKTLGLVRVPIVAIHCGLVNYHHRFPRRHLNGFLLRRMWTVLYGEGELEAVRRFFSVPKERLSVNQFGVDIDFWSPGDASENDYVLSVGNDGRRDYELLVKVAAQVDCRFIIVTKRPIHAEIPPNVEIIRGDWHAEALTDKELRRLYRQARCVVIPLLESYQPSGQSVCLQAMACGKPVILTRTRGLWSKSMMRDGENVLLVPPGDAQALIRCLQNLLENPFLRKKIGINARDTVCREGNICLFADRLEKVCEAAMMNA